MEDKTEKSKVFVVGHRNPDTDSICSAISYTNLKNAAGTDTKYVACRAEQHAVAIVVCFFTHHHAHFV